MAISNQFSRNVSVFRRFPPLEREFTLAGYAALIEKNTLPVPAPDRLCAIGLKHKRVEEGRWRIFTPRHKPEDSLKGHLNFALKHEGVDLAALKALFDQIDPREIIGIVEAEPTGAYSRRIWFLYEWLTDRELELDDASQGNFVPVVNEKLQYAAKPRVSRRHRVRNNLPGGRAFCPLIRRTDKLDRLIDMKLAEVAKDYIGETHADLISRAAAFLLLEDSKASYAIEGESPPRNRIERWGKIIGEAGQHQLSVEELERLQSIVLADMRFIAPGVRITGGFIGRHDRRSGMPIPAHISAKPEDLESLLAGLFETSELLGGGEFDIVLMAALIAFGFVFIHPFEDGNGRIHRYLIHHVLCEQGFVPKGLTFPVSAVILDRIDEYRKVLEHYSKPRLEFVQWRPTNRGNIEVLNETIDLFRYFDCTKQAEFLFECVEETVNKTLPDEVDYLKKYDQISEHIKNHIDMPNRLVDLLIRFLRQNNGKLSKRARRGEFSALTEDEVKDIEEKYGKIFLRIENRVPESKNTPKQS